MAITNLSRPASSLSNASKVSIGETWATISSTWASETRTWLAISQLITNTLKARLEYLATQALDYLMTEDSDYLVTGVNRITNIPKP